MRAVFFTVLLVMGPFDAAQGQPPTGAQQPATPPAPGTPTGGAAGETSPSRATGEPATIGTAVIRGRVVRADTGQPLRRAQIKIESEDSRSVTTDDAGRFEISRLREGRYVLTASKGGFSQVVYGQRRPFGSGRPVALRQGQIVESIDFALPPGGVMTGRVVDDAGEPAVGAQVVVSRLAYSNGRRQPIFAGIAQADDRGEFRVFGLSPGEYFLQASYPLPDNPGGTRVGLVPTFYPGTPVRAEAQRVAVKAGEEIAGLTVPLALARTAAVSGVVRNVDGSAGVLTFVSARDSSGAFGMHEGASSTGTDGTFEITNLPPGSYTLEARSLAQQNAAPARADVVINGRDVSGIVLEIPKGVTARGRVRFDTGAPPKGLSPAQVRVFSTPDDPNETSINGLPAAVRDDWTFEIAEIGGHRLLNVAVLQGNWLPRRIIVNGEDMTDTPIDFRADVDGIEIMLTQKLTELAGRVTDGSGSAVTDAVVIVFAEDPEKRGRARYLMTARPDQDGRFRVRGLRPETYVAVAVEDIEAGEESNPELLEQLKPLGTRLRLSDAESRTLNLRLSAY